MNNVAEAISMGLTPATIILALAVIYHWWRTAISTVYAIEKDSVAWLILGVVISFIGQCGDNIYWGIAWTLHAIDSPEAEMWFNNGVYNNIPFRQTLGIIAAFCHLKAANLSLKTLICFSAVLGFILMLFIFNH